MTGAMLPRWAAIVVTALLAVVLVIHLQHIVRLGGRHRLWHTVHVTMAAGMIVMFVPTPHMLIPPVVGVVFFAVAAAALLGLIASAPVPPERIGALWLVSVLDLAAMSYMFAMTSVRIGWLSISLAIWFALQTFGWAGTGLTALLDRGGLGGAPPAGATAVVAPPRATASARLTDRAVLRLSLGFMAAAMAYMLLAMQFHPMQFHPTMAAMPGM